MLNNVEYQMLIDIGAELSCSLCKELFTLPHSLPCNHSFCKLCIDNSIFKDNSCPECNTYTRPKDVKKSLILENMVQAYERFHSFVKVIPADEALKGASQTSHFSQELDDVDLVAPLHQCDSSMTRLSTSDMHAALPVELVTRVSSSEPTQVLPTSRNDSLDRKRSFDSQLTTYSKANTLSQSEQTSTAARGDSSFHSSRSVDLALVADTYAPKEFGINDSHEDRLSGNEVLHSQHTADSHPAAPLLVGQPPLSPVALPPPLPAPAFLEHVPSLEEAESVLSESERKRRRRLVVPDTYAQFDDLGGGDEGETYVGESLDDDEEEGTDHHQVDADDFVDSPMIGSHFTYGTSWNNDDNDDDALMYDGHERQDQDCMDVEGDQSNGGGEEEEEEEHEEEHAEDDWVEHYLTQTQTQGSQQLQRVNIPARAAHVPAVSSFAEQHPESPQSSSGRAENNRRIRFEADSQSSEKSPSSFRSDAATSQRSHGDVVVADTYAAGSFSPLSRQQESSPLNAASSARSQERVETSSYNPPPVPQHPRHLQQHQQQQQPHELDSSRTTLGERGQSFYDQSQYALQELEEPVLPLNGGHVKKSQGIDPPPAHPVVIATAVCDTNREEHSFEAHSQHPRSSSSPPRESEISEVSCPGPSQFSTCGFLEYQMEARKGAIERILSNGNSSSSPDGTRRPDGRNASLLSSLDEEEDEDIGRNANILDDPSSSAVHDIHAVASSPLLLQANRWDEEGEIMQAVEAAPPPAVVMSEGLSRTQRDWLAACGARGWTRLLQPGEVLANTSRLGAAHPRHVLVVSAVGVRDGWAMTSRTLLYLKALCIGVLVVDAQWLQRSLEQKDTALSVLDPLGFEVGGTYFDEQVGVLDAARRRKRDLEGRGTLLTGFSFAILSPEGKVPGRVVLTAGGPQSRSSDESAIIEEGEVRWMIHMCGGTVVDGHQRSSSSSSCYPHERSKHITLALRLRDEVPLSRVSSQHVVSVSWLVDVICNQRLPAGEREESNWDGYSVPLKYYVEANT